MPPLLPPSGQGSLLLRLLAPEAGQSLTSPRSVPTRKRKKSKTLVELAILVVFVLHFDCFTLNLFLFRTLIQRAAKRAKVPLVVIDDEPTATAGGAPETNLPDPAADLQGSPQRNPQRKYMVYFRCLARMGAPLLFLLLISGSWLV